MIATFVLLAQLVHAQPVQPVVPAGPAECDDANSMVSTFRLDEQREMTLTRNAAGAPIRAVVKRIDGRQMTCDPYLAWVSHDFHCGQAGACSNYYTANGVGGGTSRSAACLAAKADGCSQTACSPGTYGYCGTVEAVNGIFNGSEGGGCSYGGMQYCSIGGLCTF